MKLFSAGFAIRHDHRPGWTAADMRSLLEPLIVGWLALAVLWAADVKAGTLTVPFSRGRDHRVDATFDVVNVSALKLSANVVDRWARNCRARLGPPMISAQ
jgi:hypothetical protein